MEGNINGFSKLSKQDKINWIAQTYFSNSADTVELIEQYWNSDEELQKLHDEFIENTITNFYLPFGVAPNFRINDRWYTIPMVIEESSVVAAASKAAKFWSERGGFKTTILGTEKIGQVHFIYKGDKSKLVQFIKDIDSKFYEDTNSITQNMQKRGGGISAIELRDKTADVDNYYQLHVTFETKDSMGANFINSCLEQIAKTLKTEAMNCTAFTEEEKAVDVVMSILSNYVPNCVVRAEVSCPIEDLKGKDIKEPQLFAEKFVQAVRIAEVEPFRAVTHNKGVMNGVDAVVLATGNDFRAIEAGVHAYAARSGQYSSLSHASIENGVFKFWIDLPLALGTVGGLTSLHPMVKVALKMLQSPSATELMQIIAVAGLAQNFAAVKSLTTTGIQQGHMKMHLMNILNQFKATDAERVKVVAHFEKNVVSHSAVVELLESLRK
ncbi:hydroxymethylglutaryl-CoA reductase [Myroides odoratimimus]|uniref:3-hydroxy-3-methylglutaryl coenzyme A reductase n=1 Tax=Myroides odoratimimus CCUG 10230 TaxID=883150 RepID=A0ABN0ECT5_9FLAO|nr:MULTISPECIES: hydroxymethylglutaryl-CoA reductase, degradative [Myroides]AJA68716.1 3-hydroxy-3-methylglutaryl-coenzyme A reductase [Myroides sp. A21]EHO11129.1 hydroxymethylglutaryl-CoA reductase, degradative [Myroides odoratimimus CCUG 10230]EPH09906.1 hydroxymethylglutaryl-CoA reductase, degradative [Myroides odoratimimus CCUG 12700]MDM1065069.1 hydroxymethylglutaryl-CoA reductase, degradative [Myroides odoratimimus]MDM1083873.1 hydroxymethylglutaryl-CoA reductase, degradative [Myroides 